jgi:hypothetical protein
LAHLGQKLTAPGGPQVEVIKSAGKINGKNLKISGKIKVLAGCLEQSIFVQNVQKVQEISIRI